jgi:uncharacterized protein
MVVELFVSVNNNLLTNRRAADNMGFSKIRADGSAISGKSFFNFSSGRTSNAEHFILNFIKIFSIGSGSRRTEFYFPYFAKPCSLAVMQTQIITSNKFFKPSKLIMRHSRIKNSFLTVVLFISSSSLFGQKLEPKKRILEPDTTITSKIMGKDYQLYISFPSGYSNKDTTKYPVLYVLDGSSSFPLFKSAREAMDLGNELEKVIIVGIGSGRDLASWYINRNYDYTNSKDTTEDRKRDKQFGVPKGTFQSGGAENFLKCITSEIIPYLDTHYKTTNDRGITGHSLGGLFTAWCFINTKGVFTRFGINSPSLWWNSSEALTQAESFFDTHKTLDIPFTKVFISVGEKENPIMNSVMEKYSTLLENKAYKNVSPQNMCLVVKHTSL